MAAQQAELQGRLAALAVLGERREALADHLASINLLIAQAKVGWSVQRAVIGPAESGTSARWLLVAWPAPSIRICLPACLSAYLLASCSTPASLTPSPSHSNACLALAGGGGGAQRRGV